LHHLNEIAPNSAPLYKGRLYKMYTQILTVLPYPLPPSLRPFYTLLHIYTMRNYPVYASPNSVNTVIQVQILVSHQVHSIGPATLPY